MLPSPTGNLLLIGTANNMLSAEGKKKSLKIPTPNPFRKSRFKSAIFSNNKLQSAPPMQINAHALCLTLGHTTENRRLSLWWIMSLSMLRRKQHPFSSCWWSPLWPTLIIAWLGSAPVLPLICFRGGWEHPETTSTLNPLTLKCCPFLFFRW